MVKSRVPIRNGGIERVTYDLAERKLCPINIVFYMTDKLFQALCVSLVTYNHQRGDSRCTIASTDVQATLLSMRKRTQQMTEGAFDVLPCAILRKSGDDLAEFLAQIRHDHLFVRKILLDG